MNPTQQYSPAEHDAMRTALDAAAQGPARNANPRVGAVVMRPEDGRVIAVGHHRGSGTPHAEVDAIGQVLALPDGAAVLRGSTVVVTLEPCNHTGRTGPCAQALVAAGVGRVVYAASDPGDASSGGADTLRAAGIEVVGGVLAEESEALNADWARALRLGRPYVIAKWGQSVDGRAAAADGSSQWITGPESRADVHRVRAACDGIAVGTGTLLADDPELTARTESGLYPDQPLPVVFGRRPIPESARITGRAPLQFDGTDLAADLSQLRQHGIRTLYVEGGPRLVSSFLSANLVDEIHVYIAPMLIGGPKVALQDLGVSTLEAAHRFTMSDVTRLGDDVRIVLTPKED